MPIPLVIVIAIAVIAMLIWQRMRLKTSLAENKDKEFGAVAERLGLRVEEGDPNTNLLYFMQPRGDYKRQLRAAGKPYDHAASFILMDGVQTSEYIVYRRVTHSYGCFLDVTLEKSLSPFEVVLRNPNQYLIPLQGMAERGELSQVRSGDAAVDAQFVIRAADPQVAAALVPALQILSGQLFVHIAGEGNRLWMSVTRMALPYFAQAAEEYMLALETAVCALEERPLPARITVPVMPPSPKAIAQ